MKPALESWRLVWKGGKGQQDIIKVNHAGIQLMSNRLDTKKGEIPMLYDIFLYLVHYCH